MEMCRSMASEIVGQVDMEGDAVMELGDRYDAGGGPMDWDASSQESGDVSGHTAQCVRIMRGKWSAGPGMHFLVEVEVRWLYQEDVGRGSSYDRVVEMVVQRASPEGYDGWDSHFQVENGGEWLAGLKVRFLVEAKVEGLPWTNIGQEHPINTPEQLADVVQRQVRRGYEWAWEQQGRADAIEHETRQEDLMDDTWG
ncbi:hypothetical protein BJY04DRAFT_199293 [Aspergillus karnatakaensis]|uniref:uncharacterized protein n=1 Tax=Aspergillus karnatakaensis TaxID=1810916 RepID=UPI003CCCF657